MPDKLRACLIILASLLLQIPAVATASNQQLDFERLDVDGNAVKLSDFRGQWVVVNFWATWCGPCIKEIPELQHLHDKHPAATVIGVNFETIAPDALKAFMAAIDMTYPVVRVGDAPLIPFEPLKGLPSTFVVSPEGSFTTGHVGPVDCDWLNQHTGSRITCPQS